MPMVSALLVALLPLFARPARAADLQQTIAGIEADCGGRLGVALLDSASGALSGHRLDERFPMCSTFKALLAAAPSAPKIQSGRDAGNRDAGHADDTSYFHSPAAKRRCTQAWKFPEPAW